MKRFEVLWRKTWWLWVGLIAFGLFAGIRFGGLFFIIVPIAMFSFVYFAMVRFDENGNHKGD